MPQNLAAAAAPVAILAGMRMQQQFLQFMQQQSQKYRLSYRELKLVYPANHIERITYKETFPNGRQLETGLET